MKYILDLDDTICRHENRDYENAKPIAEVIDAMQKIRKEDSDAKIVIFTARGMNSCSGNVSLARERNEPILREWLSRNNVPYDEIIFGKPLGDVYIDDKAIHTSIFTKNNIARMNGFSGAECWRVGNIVIKRCKNADMQNKWYEEFGSYSFRWAVVPKIYAFTLGTLYMEYISGVPCNKILVQQIVETIREFAEINLCGTNDIKSYSEYVCARAEKFGVKFNDKLHSFDVLRKRTFCHGDFSASNIIPTASGRIALIDPIERVDISSWLLDASKFRLSLDGLEDVILPGRNYKLNFSVSDFDKLFTDEELSAIKALEKTQVIRILPYTKTESQRIGLLEIYNRI